MKKRLKNDRGALIVEATIVFPICLIIIIMLLYLGNVYYQKSRIEAIVVEAVMDGAAYSVDPLLKAVEESEGNKIPGLGSVEYKPYRYVAGLFGGMDDIENSVRTLISSRIGNLSTGLYSGMKPTGYNSNLSVKYNASFIASSVSVDLQYKIELPIRLLGERDRVSMKFNSHNEVPVSDSPEFIRNVNLVDDLLEVTGVKEDMMNMIDTFREKLNELFGK